MDAGVYVCIPEINESHAGRVSEQVDEDSTPLPGSGLWENADGGADAQDEICLPYSSTHVVVNIISKQETGFIEINRPLPTPFSKC